MNIEIVLRGSLVGPIWWPAGMICITPFRIDLKRERARIGTGKASLRDVIDLIVTEKGGDFQHCKLTQDSTIEARLWDSPRHNVSRQLVRHWPITAFSSIKDYVSENEFEDA
jgi:hypothetical protein